MANPTTYFGWVMPTSSSLVTNLPADFNTFGQGVDTSLQDLLGGTTGQVLSKTSATNMDFTWVTPTDQTPLTTKGDIFAFSTVDARLPAGTNETRLVADSAQTLGLKYVADTTNYAIAAKGDLLAGTAADTLQALSVGTNGQTLVADNTASTGLKWATPSAGGGYQVVKASTTFTSVADTGTTFDNIFSSSYNFYMVQITTLGGGSSGTDDIQMQMIYSGTTETSAYYGTTFGNIHSAASPTSTATSGASQFTMSPIIGGAGNGDRTTGVINFYQVFGTSSAGAFQGQILQGSQYGNYVFAGQSSTPRTYTGFKLKASAGNITGTLTVYGLV